MPTELEKKVFGRRLRNLCDEQRWSAPKLSKYLSTNVPDYSVSDASVKLWWKGTTAPRERKVVEALDSLLGTHGELLAILGLRPGLKLMATYGDDDEDRLDAIEAELTRQRHLLDEVLRRLPEPQGGE